MPQYELSDLSEKMARSTLGRAPALTDMELLPVAR